MDSTSGIFLTEEGIVTGLSGMRGLRPCWIRPLEVYFAPVQRLPRENQEKTQDFTLGMQRV